MPRTLHRRLRTEKAGQRKKTAPITGSLAGSGSNGRNRQLSKPDPLGVRGALRSDCRVKQRRGIRTVMTPHIQTDPRSNLIGSAWMIGAMACFALEDALLKRRVA